MCFDGFRLAATVQPFPTGSRTVGPRSKPQENGARRYRVIAVSLYVEEADAADRITASLRQVGWPKANRSLVIREAILRFADELAGKSSEEIFRFFVDRYARRAGQLPSAPANARRADHD
jgi:hypothetical protein